MALNLRSDKFQLQSYSQGLERTVREKINDLESKVADLKEAKDMI